MSSPLQAMYNGTFTTDATPSPVTLSLPAGATEIEIVNLTDFNTPAATIVRSKGYSSTAAGHAITYTGNGATPNVITQRVITTGGFTFFADSGLATPGAAVAVTGITNATPAVVSSASAAVVGDVVRVYGTTGMHQVAGMDFSVTAVNPGVTQTLGYLPAAGFAAPATAGFIRILPFKGVPLRSGSIAPDPRFYPRSRYITAISQAASAVITMSVAHSFTVGEQIRIVVPSEFGMTQINNVLARITAVNYTNNTITVNVDSTGFSAFAFPTSATAGAGVTFAQVVPVGEAAIGGSIANSLADATRNTSINGVIIGASALVASKSYAWIAKRGLTI